MMTSYDLHGPWLGEPHAPIPLRIKRRRAFVRRVILTLIPLSIVTGAILALHS